MHKVFNAIAIQNFKLSSPCVLVTLIYVSATYHDRLEIIGATLILVSPYIRRSFCGLAPTDYTHAFVATQAT